MSSGKQESPTVTVDGRAVKEFRAIVGSGPGSIPPHLLTRTGCWPISRVYFADGVFDVGEGAGRCPGGLLVQGARYVTGKGLIVELTQGYSVWAPEDSIRATWRD